MAGPGFPGRKAMTMIYIDFYVLEADVPIVPAGCTVQMDRAPPKTESLAPGPGACPCLDPS